MMMKTVHYTYGTFLELFASIRCFLLSLFATPIVDIPPEGSEGKPDILCVHGYLHNDTPWGFFRRHLQKAGAGSVNAIRYNSIADSISKNSLRIKEKIDWFKKTTGRDVQILIGHSQGGLQCLEYALEYAPKDQITYVIALSSPLHGTKMSKIGFGPSAKQMGIGSAYLKGLHERLKDAKHIRLLALASEVDLIIRPPTSALMTEYPFVKNVLLKNTGHVTFLFSRKVIRNIIDFLRAHSVLS